MQTFKHNGGLPPKQGLYDPANEHDACGVGFVVNMRGEKSHADRPLRSRDSGQSDASRGLRLRSADRRRRRHLDANAARVFRGQSAGSSASSCPRGRLRHRHGLFAAHRVRAAAAARSGSRRSWPRKAKRCSAGATCRSTTACWGARRATSSRSSGRFSSPAASRHAARHVRVEAVRHSQAVGDRRSAAAGWSRRQYCYIPSLSSRVIIYKGLLLAEQVERFYHDLADERFVSRRWRWSISATAPTRFPTWDLAHPFRFLAHNGEINTLKGNVNWMHARESLLAHPVFGPDLKKICPVCVRGASDSAVFDNALELLVLTGRSLPQAMSMLDSRAVAEPREHARRPESLLRISGLPDRALGRPGLDGLYRRHDDGRRAGSQRPAPQPLLGHQGRAGRHGVGSGRARHSAATRSSPRAACDRAACSWSTRPRGGSSPTTKSNARWPRAIPIASGFAKTSAGSTICRRSRRSTAIWTSRCSRCSGPSATRWKICGS